MPWPMKNRELCLKVATFVDPYNRACYAISTSVAEEATVLGIKSPKCKKGLQRMVLNYQVDYFQYISENVTRYLYIQNCDPKVTSLSASKIDYLVKQSLKKDILGVINYPPKLLDPKFKRFKQMQKDKPKWEAFMKEFMKGEHAEVKQLEDKPVDVNEEEE